MRVLLLLALAALPAAGETFRLADTGDTSIAAAEGERTYNHGASTRIRIKGIQHFLLVKFDLAPVNGCTVSRAVLHLKSASKGLRLRTVGLSTVSKDWTEGAGRGEPVPGAACFQYAAHPDRLWAGPQSDFTDVTFTAGNTLAAYTDIRPVADGWLEIDVPPALVQAMICGDSYGLVVSDEKGQTWANNDVFSREQSGCGPYLIVEAARVDTQPPDAPNDLIASPASGFAHLTSGALRLTFHAPKDAFTYEGDLRAPGAQPTSIPRWAIPHAAPGEAQEVLLTDLPPNTCNSIRLRAVDGAGNRSTWAEAEGASSPALPRVTLRAAPAAPPSGERPSPVSLAPATVKVNPVTGCLLEDGAGQYGGVAVGAELRSASAHRRRALDLLACRNQFVSFQVVVEPPALPAEAAVRVAPFRCAAGKTLSPNDVELSREWYVKDGEQWYPEVAVPLSGPLPVPAADNAVPGQRNQAVWVDLYVPHDAAVGKHEGAAEVTLAGETQRLPITLQVVDATLPDGLTFNLDLNGYGPVGGLFGVSDASAEYRAIERDYHRLAHRHRATLDLLGYSQSGNLSANYAPPVTGHGDALRVTDWASWDAQFGPYLSGEAFADCPRAGVPVHNLYLWLHENWPERIADHYDAPAVSAEFPLMVAEHAMRAKPIDQAFDADFAAGFRAAAREIARHFAERGWTRTAFQCYLNDKVNFKDPKQGGRGTSWWLLDEPSFRDDWLALSYFGRLFKAGVAGVAGPRLVFREDISRPQWQRDWLRGTVDLMVVSDELFRKNRRCLAIQRETGCRLWNYGQGNAISASNAEAALWPLRAYLAGADAIVPWNTIGTDASFTRPDPTAIIYPGKRFGVEGPLASLRLKAFRQGAQDVELLALLAKQHGWNREQTAQAIAQLLGEKRTDDEIAAAPWSVVEGLTVLDLERLRASVLLGLVPSSAR